MKRKPAKPTLFDSMGQAAASLGVSMEAMKSAKRKGCPAFKPGGRVDSKVFLKWVSENHTAFKQDANSLREQKVYEEVRKLRIANDEKEKKLVAVSKIETAVRNCGLAIDAITENKLCNEYPEAVAGLDVAGARVYGRRLKDSMIAEIRKLAETWR